MNEIIKDNTGSFFYGYLGVAAAISLSNLGAAYGTAKAGVGICTIVILKLEIIIKAIIPVIMAGILGICGLIVGVLLVQKIKNDKGNFLILDLSI